MKLSLFAAYYCVGDAELATALGVSRSLISRYRHGNRIPGKKAMMGIYRITGGLVCPNDFYDLPPLRPNSNRFAHRRAGKGRRG